MAWRTWLRPSSIASRNASHKLVDGTGWEGCYSDALNSTPNPVVTSLVLAGFAVALAFPFAGRLFGVQVEVGVGVAVEVDRVDWFCRVGAGGHPSLVGRFFRCSPPPFPRRAPSHPRRFQIGAGGPPTPPGLLLDAPQWPSEPSEGNHLLFFRSSLKTLLISTKASVPGVGFNVPEPHSRRPVLGDR